MLKKSVRGAFDPITMGFILAVAGAVAAISLDGNTPSESQDAQASSVASESTESAQIK